MTPRQTVIFSAACIAGGIAVLAVLLAYVKRGSRTGKIDLPAEDDLREMETRIVELGESLARAEAAIADLREMLADSGAMAPLSDRNAESDRTGEIVRLHETGMDLLEIARRIDMPVGEVELVLNLHRWGKTGAAARQ